MEYKRNDLIVCSNHKICPYNDCIVKRPFFVKHARYNPENVSSVCFRFEQRKRKIIIVKRG